MTEIPEENPNARRLWNMLQRVGMQIAGKPLEQRGEAFAVAERSLREWLTRWGLLARGSTASLGMR
jgi:hypothetical protein